MSIIETETVIDMNIEQAKHIVERRFNGVRSGEFSKETLLDAMQFVRDWKYENDPKYRAQMNKAFEMGKSLKLNRA